MSGILTTERHSTEKFSLKVCLIQVCTIRSNRLQVSNLLSQVLDLPRTEEDDEELLETLDG